MDPALSRLRPPSVFPAPYWPTPIRLYGVAALGELRKTPAIHENGCAAGDSTPLRPPRIHDDTCTETSNRPNSHLTKQNSSTTLEL